MRKCHFNIFLTLIICQIVGNLIKRLILQFLNIKQFIKVANFCSVFNSLLIHGAINILDETLTQLAIEAGAIFKCFIDFGFSPALKRIC